MVGDKIKGCEGPDLDMFLPVKNCRLTEVKEKRKGKRKKREKEGGVEKIILKTTEFVLV